MWQGFGGLRCEQVACDPVDLCGSGGRCTLGNTCECFDGYSGEKCDVFAGALGDTPATKAPIKGLEDVDLANFSLDADLGGGLKGLQRSESFFLHLNCNFNFFGRLDRDRHCGGLCAALYHFVGGRCLFAETLRG